MKIVLVCAENILGNSENHVCHSVLPIGSHWFGLYWISRYCDSAVAFGGIDDGDWRVFVIRLDVEKQYGFMLLYKSFRE